MADRLAPFLQEQLRKIEPVEPFRDVLYPCALEMQDGTVFECAYLVETTNDRRDRAPLSPFNVDLSQIKRIRESRHRVPAKVARELYQSGESGMGYYYFRLHFIWPFRRAYLLSASLIDFEYFPWYGRWFGHPGPIFSVVRGRGSWTWRQKLWPPVTKQPKTAWVPFRW